MKFKILAIVALFLFVGASRVSATTDIPNFPACSSPSGSVKVSYASGIHGIPGDSGEYVGSDIVYTISDSSLVQCFCAATGTGIQTNWWKQDSLSQEQLNSLTSQGWILIPDGSAWGLDPVPYLAKNSPFSCGGGQITTTSTGSGQPGAGPAPVCDSAKPGTPVLLSVTRTGSTALLVWTAASQATHYTIAYGTTPGNYPYGVPNTGNVTSFTVDALDPDTTYYFAVRAVNNCMPGDFATLGGGTGGGQVLGLASTGDSVLIYSLITLGVLLLALSWLKSRNENRA